MFYQLSIEEFHRKLSSDSIAPGGGSVAALSGALAAGLVSMVCRLSLGKTDYEAFHGELTDAIQKSELLSESLMKRIDLDPEAFSDVIDALKMPHEPPMAEQAREAAIQRRYKSAVESGLGIARECLGILRIVEGLLGKSNANALSELVVASLQAYAGLEGSILTAKMDIPCVHDRNFVSSAKSESAALLETGLQINKRIRTYFSERAG
jgi:formiminotetrahydrofolate cyclodeaminase